ncbi:MAG: 3'(2'),5'-bisphosphate nucleotidase [Alphaproteobacteria bacterium]|nr:3'(2'),5'-bisphosphate nucleotidase [Alphaproteobacteria bacterium]
MKHDPAGLIPAVRTLAYAAGNAILDIYRTDFDSTRKDDGSPLTLADTASEAVIVPGLRALSPEIPVISEEEFANGESPKDIGERFWLVDPLDGTREFLKRNDEFTVNIGLVDAGVPRVGILYAPALDLMYAGATGQGATLIAARGQERAIACRRVPIDGMAVLVSRSHARNEKLEEYLGDMHVQERIPQGSALKFGRLAAGEADIYPRFGPTYEWDTGAGHAIVLAAGGSLETFDGKPLPYRKPGYLNPGFVAFGLR